MSSGSGVKRKNDKETDWRSIVERLKSHVQWGTVQKLFEEEQQFIFELIKILYEDVLDFHLKMDVLSTIEQECCGFINKNSVDQVVASLVDIFETEQGNQWTMEIREQLLITITTILIENDEILEQEQGSVFISKLYELLRKTNSVSSRRLRAMACNCLTQIEEWKPGILWKWKDSLIQMSRDERTNVCQDYLQLLITVIKNILEESIQEFDDKGILQTVSYVMDNISLLTGPGALAILNSVIGLVQGSMGISPSVFKPMMLQYTPCMDPCILFLMLFIQNKFRGEILSADEEKIFLLKALDVVKHASIGSKTRLLTIQWLTSYIKQHKTDLCLQELQKRTRPTVFDPLIVHSCKLLLHCICSSKSNVVSKDLHYLNQLARTTGGVRVTRSLYYILHSHVCYHSCEEVHTFALSVSKNLFQKFPNLIPLIVDFLQTLQISKSNAKFHLEVLTLLHNTVLAVPLTSLLSNYQNFLQVWVLSAQDPSMHLQKQLRHMLELAKEANTRALDDWLLGCLLLSICRTMMLHHQTDIFYCQMGDLLFYMMRNFNDPEVQDHARFYYALLTLTSNVKVKEILNADLVDNLRFGENLADFFPGSMSQVLPSDIRMIDDTPIHCVRKCVSVEFQELNPEKDADKSPSDYFDWYRNGKMLFKPIIKCELTASIKEETDMDNLIAVSFNINNQQKNILIEEIHVPFMSKREKTTISFQFYPNDPIPCTLSLRSFFSHERATLQCDLDPVLLNLTDFLVPFPWDTFSIKEDKRQQLFDCLWGHCTIGHDDNKKGVESVKIIPCNSYILSKLWKDAQVTKELASPRTSCFLFLLVPSFHFLLRTRSRLADTVVEIASDFPQVLEYVDNFLEELDCTND